MDATNVTVAVALLLGMAAGGTEFVRRIFDKDYKAAAIIAVSAVIGYLGGTFLLPVIGPAVGLVTGLSASGYITGLQKFGQGTDSSPTPLERPKD